MTNNPADEAIVLRARGACQDPRHGIPALEMRREPWDCQNCNRISAALRAVRGEAIEASAVIAEKFEDSLIGGSPMQIIGRIGISKAIRNQIK